MNLNGYGAAFDLAFKFDSELEWWKILEKTLADRLKTAREGLKLSQKDMAKALGIAYTSWLGYEDGANVPGGKVLEGLARLGVDLNWLLMGEESKPDEKVKEPAAQWQQLGHIDLKPDNRRLDDRYCYIPLYNVAASAGGGAMVDQEHVVDTLAFKHSWIKTHLNATQQDLYLIHVEGESMEPTLRPGDVILVDHREGSQLPRDGIYVLRMDDSLLVKRLQRMPGSQVRVSSDNPAYEPFTVSLAQEKSEMEIVGRVVWCGRRM